MNKPVFSQTLQALRKEKKVTQEQFAEYLGVSAQAVSKWENGSFPESDLLPKIADYYGVSVDYLYGRGDKDKSVEQTVLEKLQDIYDEDLKDHGHHGAHNMLLDFIRRLHWTAQIAPWKGNRTYYDPPYLGDDNPKAAAVYYDDQFCSYMGLSQNSDFQFFVSNPIGKQGFENLFKNSADLCGLFKILSDKDAVAIIGYLYSLSAGEYAGVKTISKAVGVSEDKVEKTLKTLFDQTGKNSGNKPFVCVKVLIGEKEENAYGVHEVFGGLLMALMLAANEYVNPPSGFNMMIGNRNRSWLDREVLKN